MLASHPILHPSPFLPHAPANQATAGAGAPPPPPPVPGDAPRPAPTSGGHPIAGNEPLYPTIAKSAYTLSRLAVNRHRPATPCISVDTESKLTSPRSFLDRPQPLTPLHSSGNPATKSTYRAGQQSRFLG